MPAADVRGGNYLPSQVEDMGFVNHDSARGFIVSTYQVHFPDGWFDVDYRVAARLFAAGVTVRLISPRDNT
jgi:hypothetical protein